VSLGYILIYGAFCRSSRPVASTPKENVRLKNESIISLMQYAARHNLQLVTAADFNEKLRERGVDRLTVQAISRVARDEKQVRRALDDLWKKPKRANEIIAKLRFENTDINRFKECLKREILNLKPIK